MRPDEVTEQARSFLLCGGLIALIVLFCLWLAINVDALTPANFGG